MIYAVVSTLYSGTFVKLFATHEEAFEFVKERVFNEFDCDIKTDEDFTEFQESLPPTEWLFIEQCDSLSVGGE